MDIKNLQQQHQLRLYIKAIPLPVLKDIKSMAINASRTFTDVYYTNPMFTQTGARWRVFVFLYLCFFHKV